MDFGIRGFHSIPAFPIDLYALTVIPYYPVELFLILFSLFSKGVFNDKLVHWACLVLVVLKVLELILQIKASEPFAAMVGLIVVLLLIAGFLVIIAVYFMA